MSSNNEFSSITDNLVSALMKAEEEINTWAVSETGLFLREISADARVVMEQPERAGANLRNFVQENPEAVLRFSAGCLAMIKVMAAKRPKSRKDKGDKVSYEEALMDGWSPQRPAAEIFEDLGFIIDLQQSALKAREGKNAFGASDDAVLAGYAADLASNVERGDGFASQMLAKVMEASTVESVRYFGQLCGTVFTPPTEERETFYEAFNEMDQMVTDRYAAMASLAEPVTYLQESLIDLPTVTWRDNEATWRINVARRDEIIEALREQVATDLEEVRKAVDDYPAEGDKAAVSWLMDTEGSLRGDQVDLYQVVSLIDRMGTIGVSAFAREAGQRLLTIVARYDA